MKKLVFAAVAAMAIISASNAFAFNNNTAAAVANTDSTQGVDSVQPAQQDTVAPATADTAAAQK